MYCIPWNKILFSWPLFNVGSDLLSFMVTVSILLSFFEGRVTALSNLMGNNLLSKRTFKLNFLLINHADIYGLSWNNWTWHSLRIKIMVDLHFKTITRERFRWASGLMTCCTPYLPPPPPPPPLYPLSYSCKQSWGNLLASPLSICLFILLRNFENLSLLATINLFRLVDDYEVIMLNVRSTEYY